MLFLKSVSILVEIKEFNNGTIVGDELTFVPQQVLDKSFDNVNWNRMLKYTTSDLDKQITRDSFHKANYDLYLDTTNMKLVVLAKSSFDELVSKQTKFQKEFISNLIKMINFNKQTSDYQLPKELFNSYLIEQYKGTPKQINNFVVNKDFVNTNNKFKFKNIYQLDSENKTVETKNKQFVHHVSIKELNLDPILANAKYIDLDNCLVYLDGYVLINNEKVYLNLVFEDKENINNIKQKLSQLF